MSENCNKACYVTTECKNTNACDLTTRKSLLCSFSKREVDFKTNY